MLKLMKYEFRKTAFSKLILLCITMVVEIVYLLGVFLKKDNLLFIGIMLLTLCATAGILYIGLESINVLQRDLNTKQSYMLFLTPKEQLSDPWSQDFGKWNFYFADRSIFCSSGSD